MNSLPSPLGQLLKGRHQNYHHVLPRRTVHKYVPFIENITVTLYMFIIYSYIEDITQESPSLYIHTYLHISRTSHRKHTTSVVHHNSYFTAQVKSPVAKAPTTAPPTTPAYPEHRPPTAAPLVMAAVTTAGLMVQLRFVHSSSLSALTTHVE